MTPREERLIISVCLVLLNPAIWAIYKLFRIIKRRHVNYDENGYVVSESDLNNCQ